MDIIRNVGVREQYNNDASLHNIKSHSSSLPNLTFTSVNSVMYQNPIKKQLEEPVVVALQPQPQQPPVNVVGTVYEQKIIATTATSNHLKPKIDGHGHGIEDNNDNNDDEINDGEECAISGKLEIRVISQQEQQNSPNPDESIYFDAITNGSGAAVGNKQQQLIKQQQQHLKNGHHDSITTTINNKTQPIINDMIKSKGAISKVVTNNLSSLNDVDIINDSLDKKNDLNQSKDNKLIIDKNLIKEEKNDGQQMTFIKSQSQFPVIQKKDINQTEKLFPPTTTTTTIPNKFNGDTTAAQKNNTNTNSKTDITNSPISAPPLNDVINFRKDMTSSAVNNSNSKIPVFNQNLRISKCASWAGVDSSHNLEISDLTPGEFFF